MMKSFKAILATLTLALVCSSVFAGEWGMKVEKKGETWVAHAGDKEFVLTGAGAATIKEAGEYTITGEVSPDGKSIEVKEAVKK